LPYNEAPKPGGRPTGYQPDFPERLIESGKKGLSFTAAMAELGFDRDIGYIWKEKYPEFGEAMKLHKGYRILALENRLLTDYEAAPATTIFALKNCQSDEWKDRHEFEHGGKDGKPISITITETETNF